MSRSHILLLTICSNGKQSGGDPAYKAEGSMFQLFSEYASDMIQARQHVFRLIKDGKASRMGIPLSQFPYNSQLSEGPDFGGFAPANYMPSAERFRGRFYRELGPNAFELLTRSHHHILILCGLYGLLTPNELIQAYNCHVGDHEEIRKTWASKGILTSLLISYVERFEIALIVDLTADESFRNLIDWNRLKQQTKVLRIFGSENAGANLLPSFGVLCREWLLTASEEDLVCLQDDTRFPAGYEDLMLTRRDTPPEGFLGDAKTADRARPPISEPKGPIRILDHPRDINVTSGEHNTMFGRKIRKMSDLEPEARKIFEDASTIPDVLEIFLGRFSSAGGKSKGGYYLTLSEPKQNMGQIFCKLRGPAKIGSIQEIEIRVTRGWERETYLSLTGFSWAD